MIWALTDDRAGHTSQTLGLAQALGLPYQEKKLHYNRFAAVPNAVLGAGLSHLSAESRNLIAPVWPRAVIAAGRRLVPVMRYIKRQSPATILIQLMWPGRIEPFDWIIVPEHDRAPQHPRILRTLGALHGLTAERIAQAAQGAAHQWAHLPHPRLALLIGGGWDRAAILRLADLAELLAGKGSLLITTSRRSDRRTARWFNSRLTCPHWIYEWGSGANPYPGLLGAAEAVIVTADSISMACEACASGKPVFLFGDHTLPRKHQAFARALVAQGHAAWLTAAADFTAQPPVTLDETARIAPLLRAAIA